MSVDNGLVECDSCGTSMLAMVELRNPDTDAGVLCARCARDGEAEE